jgi:UDP-glucuronate 4-epimerase
LMSYTYSHLYDIPTTVVRFFTVYGPWGRPDMAYFLFTERILRGEPISVFHGGKLKRDYTYIDDAVEALTRLAHQPPEPAGHRIYNIGSRHPVLLLDFIATLERLLGRKAILDMKPMQPGDVTDTFADTTALRNAVDFEPSTPLEAGLSQFVSWYRSHYRVT